MTVRERYTREVNQCQLLMYRNGWPSPATISTLVGSEPAAVQNIWPSLPLQHPLAINQALMTMNPTFLESGKAKRS